MSRFQNPYDRCAVPGCTVVPVTWSRLCTQHTQRRQQHGHVLALGVRDIDLRRHRGAIRHALADLSEAPAVIAAHHEADRVLHFHAPHGASRASREIEDRMRQLRVEQTVPREVLQACCEVFFLDHEEHFRDLRSLQYALARQVCKLRSMGKWRPNTLMLGALGALLHDRFAVFALALRKRIETEADEARQRSDAMQHGWAAPRFDDDA